jgi:hypothetical protein
MLKRLGLADSPLKRVRTVGLGTYLKKGQNDALVTMWNTSARWILRTLLTADLSSRHRRASCVW